MTNKVVLTAGIHCCDETHCSLVVNDAILISPHAGPWTSSLTQPLGLNLPLQVDLPSPTVLSLLGIILVILEINNLLSSAGAL